MSLPNSNEIISYSELGEAVFGLEGKKYVNGCIIIAQIGYCVAYFLFIGKQID